MSYQTLRPASLALAKGTAKFLCVYYLSFKMKHYFTHQISVIVRAPPAVTVDNLPVAVPVACAPSSQPLAVSADSLPPAPAQLSTATSSSLSSVGSSSLSPAPEQPSTALSAPFSSLGSSDQSSATVPFICTLSSPVQICPPAKVLKRKYEKAIQKIKVLRKK